MCISETLYAHEEEPSDDIPGIKHAGIDELAVAAGITTFIYVGIWERFEQVRSKPASHHSDRSTRQTCQ